MGLALWLWTIVTGSRIKAMLRKGQKLLQANRHMEAMDHYRKITREWPTQPEGYLGMSHTYAGMGLNSEAKREKIIAKSLATLGKEPDNLKVRLELAAALLDREAFGWAATHVEHALRLAPNDQEVLRLAGRVYFANRNYRKAIIILRRLLRVNPLDLELWELLVSCLNAMGQASQAFKINSVASALKEAGQTPESPDALLKSARRLMGVGKKNMALELINTHLSRFEQDPRLHCLRGELFLEHSQYDKARESLNLALKIKSMDERSHVLLAKVFQLEGNAKMAQHHASLAKAIISARKKSSHTSPESAMARALMEQGRHDQVMEMANSILESDPEDWRGFYLKGMVLGRQNKMQEAITALQNARTLNDQAAELHMEIARVLSLLGKDKEAVKSARHAASLAPRDPGLRRDLATILRNHGYMEKAVEEEEFAESLTREA